MKTKLRPVFKRASFNKYLLDIKERFTMVLEGKDNSAFQQRIIKYLLVIAVLTTVLSFATAWTGIIRSQKPDSLVKQALQSKKPQVNRNPPSPVIDILPEGIIQYETRARQKIPGSKYPAAEAIYEILDPDIMLATPENTYAKATYFPKPSDAKLDISNMIESRFPHNTKNELIGSTIVTTGYDDQGGSYFMGWSKQSYNIVLITSFLNSVPVDKKTILKDHTSPIARSIILGVNLINIPGSSNKSKNGAGK